MAPPDKSRTSAARHDGHLHLVANARDARDLVFGFWQRDDHRQLPVHRQSVAFVGSRIFFAPQHAVFRQESFQRSDYGALPINVDGAGAFKRYALCQQLRDVRLQQWCVHVHKVSRPSQVIVCCSAGHGTASAQPRLLHCVHSCISYSPRNASMPD